MLILHRLNGEKESAKASEVTALQLRSLSNSIQNSVSFSGNHAINTPSINKAVAQLNTIHCLHLSVWQ